MSQTPLVLAIALWVLSFIFFPARLEARSEPVTSDGYIAETWNKRDGLPDTTLAKVVRTPMDGYLWVATYGGLARFNGVEFEVYNKQTITNFPSPFVVNLHCDQSNRLWVSTDQGLGIFDYLHHRWLAFGPADGWLWPSEFARTIAENREGHILITTFKGRVIEYDGRTFHEMHPPGTAGEGYLAVVDEENRWFLTQLGFTGFWDGSQWQKAPLPEGWNTNLVGAAAAKGGGVWLLQPNRLFLWKHNKTSKNTPLPKSDSTFWSMMEDSGGRVWVCSYENGLTEITPEGETQHFSTEKELLPANNLRDVFEDPEGNYWICTGGGGLTRFKSSIFKIYGANAGLANPNITSVSRDADGILYLGSYGGGVYRFDPERTKVAELIPGTGPNFVNSVLSDRRGTLWFGTYNEGAFRWKNGQAIRVPGRPSNKDEVTCIYEDAKGRVWLGGHGVQVFEENAQEFHPISEFDNLVIHCFGETDDGTLLAGGDKGLFSYRNGRFERCTYPGLAGIEDFCSLYRDADQNLWAGTLNGVILRIKNSQAKMACNTNSWPNSRIGDFMEDASGYFWIPSNNGILKVNKHELNQAVEGELARVNWNLFDEKDGVPIIVHCNSLKPCSQRDAKGRFWVATEKGLVMLDPAKSRPYPAMDYRVHFELVSFSPLNQINSATPKGSSAQSIHQTFPIPNNLCVPPGRWALEVKFAGLKYSAPEALFYDLNMRCPSVNFLKTTTERSERFYDLEPGEYQIEIRAHSREGLIGPPTQMAFQIAPFYWQTAWFKYGGSALLFITFAGLVRHLSLAKVRRRLAEMEREKQLGSLRNRLASILENTSDFVAFTDQNRHVLYLNPSGRRLIGLPESQDLPALDLANLFPSWAQKLITHTAMPEARRLGSWLGESALLHRNGTEIPVSQLILVHRNPDESIDFLSTIIRDITPLKNAEASRMKLEQQLRQAQKMEAVGLLAGGIAHDFNNILTVIKGNNCLLEPWAETKTEIRELVHEIDVSADRAAALTRQLLAFGRKQVMQPTRLNINEVMTNVTRLLRRMIPETVTIQVHCSQEPLRVLADSTQLDQALINLAVNARDAMASGGILTVQTRRAWLQQGNTINPPPAQPVECAVIEVTDTGCGIDPANQNKIFEPFFTTKDVGKGTGLGLPTVFGIVCQLNGWIQFESQLGKGSTFRIFLPLLEDQPDLPSAAVAVAPKIFPKSAITGTVLLVEDEAGVRSFLKRVLVKQGYQVHVAASGLEALELWPGIQHDVQYLITDVVMPGGITGVQLSQQLRAEKNNLKVILCSGYHADLAQIQAHHEPGIAFLQKPFDTGDIFNAIQNLNQLASTPEINPIKE